MKWPLHSLLYIKIHIHHSGDHSADFALDTLRFCCGGKWLRFCFLYCVFFGFLLQGPSVDRHAFPDVAKGVVTEQAMTTPVTPIWETWTIPARSTGDASEPTFMSGNVGLFMKESKEKEIPNLDTGETWSPVTEVFQDDQKNDVPCPSSILGEDDPEI